MLRRALISALLVATAAAPARAADEGKKDGRDVGQYVELQAVGLPIVVDRQLVNYVFVYVRINLTTGANVSRWREKEPFFRDALVRAGHSTPFNHATDLSQVDVPRLTVQRMLRAPRRASPALPRGCSGPSGRPGP